jgi:biotin operon repressor
MNNLSSLPIDRPFSDDQFAEAVGVSRETVRDWIHQYQLQGVRKCGCKVFIIDPKAFFESMPPFELGTPAPVNLYRGRDRKAKEKPAAKRGQP